MQKDFHYPIFMKSSENSYYGRLTRNENINLLLINHVPVIKYIFPAIKCYLPTKNIVCVRARVYQFENKIKVSFEMRLSAKTFWNSSKCHVPYLSFE